MATKTKTTAKQLEDEQAKIKLNAGNTDEEGFEYTTKPPDGGFGWVVAIAAMLCNLICDGTLFAFGTMKIHLQKHFECSDMLILMVGSLPCGVYLLVGPLVSGLANRYGCRIVIIIGSIGAAGCTALSTLSPNVWAMMIIYGIFGGIFFGMIYLPSVVMVSFYFEKKRAIANGLVTAGTGIGVFSFGPLAEYVMDKFGWRGGLLVFAAIILSGILFGAIMIPVKPVKVPIEPEAELQDLSKSDEKENQATSVLKHNSSGDGGPSRLPIFDQSMRASIPATVPSTDVNAESGVNASLTPINQSSRTRTVSSSSQSSSVFGSGHHRHGVSNPEDALRPLYRKDALYTGSVQQLHMSNTSLHKTNPYSASATNIPRATTEEKKKEGAMRAFLDILATMTDLSLLRNKQLLLICIGNIFSMLGYYLPIMCLVSFAVEDLKINQKHGALLMTIFGVCNTISRFASGPISMLPGLNPLRVHNALLFTSGILTVLAAYSYNFVTCALYAALCGFAIAPHISLLPSVICDCVGLENYTTACGILFLFRGVTSIIGPPAAGFLKDYTKKYDMAFALGGAMFIIGSFFHICIVCFESQNTTKTEGNDGKELKQKEIDV